MNEGFDPNTYKLMRKTSYDFNNPVVVGRVMDEETYSLNKMQKNI